MDHRAGNNFYTDGNILEFWSKMHQHLNDTRIITLTTKPRFYSLFSSIGIRQAGIRRDFWQETLYYWLWNSLS